MAQGELERHAGDEFNILCLFITFLFLIIHLPLFFFPLPIITPHFLIPLFQSIHPFIHPSISYSLHSSIISIFTLSLSNFIKQTSPSLYFLIFPRFFNIASLVLIAFIFRLVFFFSYICAHFTDIFIQCYFSSLS